MFVTTVGKEIPVLTGKFDAFRKKVLIDIGLFDSGAFRASGKGGDIWMKLSQKGKVIESKVKIHHLHGLGVKSSLRDFMYKEMQYAEGHGAVVRRYLFTPNYKSVLILLVKPSIIAIGLLPIIPYAQFLCITVVTIYSVLYRRKAFSLMKDPRIVIIPFVNAVSLLLHTLAFIRGFITGRQRL